MQLDANDRNQIRQKGHSAVIVVTSLATISMIMNGENALDMLLCGLSHQQTPRVDHSYVENVWSQTDTWCVIWVVTQCYGKELMSSLDVHTLMNEPCTFREQHADLPGRVGCFCIYIYTNKVISFLVTKMSSGCLKK